MAERKIPEEIVNELDWDIYQVVGLLMDQGHPGLASSITALALIKLSVEMLSAEDPAIPSRIRKAMEEVRPYLEGALLNTKH